MEKLSSFSVFSMAPGRSVTVLRSLLVGSLVVWAALASYFALKNQTQVRVLLMDEAGLRAIDDAEFVREQEQIAVLKQFIQSAYQLSSASAEKNAKRVRVLVTEKVLEEHQADLVVPFERAKSEKLTQTPEITDIRTLGDNRWQADLQLKIVGLGRVEHVVKLRLDLKLTPVARTASNWRAWQIGEYSEVRI